MWKYIEGNEKDFEGAPEWATERVENDKGNPKTSKERFVGWVGEKNGERTVKDLFTPDRPFDGNYGYRSYIAARRVKENEPVFLPVETPENVATPVFKRIKENCSIPTTGGEISFNKYEHVEYGGEVDFSGVKQAVIRLDERYVGLIDLDLIEDI